MTFPPPYRRVSIGRRVICATRGHDWRTWIDSYGHMSETWCRRCTERKPS